ncbi:MAG: ABC transporter permease [Alphaproteobacteria bacterium]
MTAATHMVDAEARYRRAGWFTRLRLHPAGPVALLFLLLLAGCIVASLIFPDDFLFLSQRNATLLMRAIPTFGVVALGVGLLMIAGEFDLSVGSVFVAAPFAMASFYDASAPVIAGWGWFAEGEGAWLTANGVAWAISLIVALLVATAIGLLNAFITLYFRIPSFITTLGMLFIVRTAAPYIVNLYGGRTSLTIKVPEDFKAATWDNLFGFLPASFLWFLVFAAIAYLLLNRHFLGNHFFAAGGDTKAAQFAGINVVRTKTIAFVLSSVFATISGIFSITRLGKAETNPQLFIELYAVAICVVSGLSLFGGRGSVIGIVFGSAVYYLLGNIATHAQLPTYYLDAFAGMMIVFGVIINQLFRRRF